MFGRHLASPEETYLENKKGARSKEGTEVMRYIWDVVATKLSTVNIEKFNQRPKEPLTSFRKRLKTLYSLKGFRENIIRQEGKWTNIRVRENCNTDMQVLICLFKRIPT